MRDQLAILKDCVRSEQIEIAEHAYEQIVDRMIDIEDAIMGVLHGKLIEDYRKARDEERVLVL